MEGTPGNVAGSIASAVPDDIRESVAINDVKTIGDASAFYTAQGFAEAMAHQGAMNKIREAGVSKGIEMILGTNPREGGADIAALQQLMKGAQTTPPVTP